MRSAHYASGFTRRNRSESGIAFRDAPKTGICKDYAFVIPASPWGVPGDRGSIPGGQSAGGPSSVVGRGPSCSPMYQASLASEIRDASSAV